MSEGFLVSWGRYLFNWFSFTFTVGAAIVGLILAREHWWISLLIVIAVFVASAMFAFQKQKEMADVERLAQKNMIDGLKGYIIKSAVNLANLIPMLFSVWLHASLTMWPVCREVEMIQTKVARIISDTQVVLTAGTDQGVKNGVVFLIYEVGEHITDPETGDDLGQLEFVKGKVRVFHVQERISIASTFSDYGGLRWSLPNPPRPRLNVEQTAVAELDVNSTVKIGDLARSID